MQQNLKLNMLDCLSFLTAAVCHDLGHDGFTNGFHVNANTPRAIDSNDVSVQEHYHAAELFRILTKKQNNFVEGLSKDEYKIFRKRIIGLIMATDMSHHAEAVSKLNGTISEFDIAEGKNVEKLTEGLNETELFKTQQFIMESALHCCDISQQTRSFAIAKEWTYLLFEEFFMQGDIERSREIPISMLCDRNSTNVAGAQPGFVNFVTLPVYNPLSNIFPVLVECVD